MTPRSPHQPKHLRPRVAALLRLVLIACSSAVLACAADVAPLGSKVANQISDVALTPSPSAVQIGGWLGARVGLNEKARLLTVDMELLLAGFRQKPGSHPWIGEHVGKWLHASTLAWANSGDAALKAKLDHVVQELIAAQEADGYLGTYVPEKRFGLFPEADWDVWSHKYCLIGLLTYYQYTGYEPALAAARKAADLLLNTFPAKRSILAAGTHMGMAATSVLEPVVLLYRLTNDVRYLDFARYIVRSWDEPGGPAILKTLLTQKRVDKTANAKAYEMLSNLVGLCDLARVTGERSYIEASLNAWNDIVANRLYITGTASEWEHFQDDHVLFNSGSANLGETCVTTTWIQFNLSLLQLTGDAKYGDELERSFYNHLSAAQNPEGEDWCYYTALEGAKKYDHDITCCHSSGPRGMALVPQSSYLVETERDGVTLLVNTLESSSIKWQVDGETVVVREASAFPRQGRTSLSFELSEPRAFRIKIRIPDWALPAKVDGTVVSEKGWVTLPKRQWRQGDRVEVQFNLGPRIIPGTYGNRGSAALAWGPFVLACEPQMNASVYTPPHLLGLTDLSAFGTAGGSALSFSSGVVDRSGKTTVARIIPYADAGTAKEPFHVWLYGPGQSIAANHSLLVVGTPSASRNHENAGSFIDNNPKTFVTTRDGATAKEDWYAVALPSPVKGRRIVFGCGAILPDGGWFDTSVGKPAVQIQKAAGGPWVTVGELSDYPDSTSTEAPKFSWVAGATPMISLVLPEPVEFTAVRVVGKPASGNQPSQAFSSCSEIQAFLE